MRRSFSSPALVLRVRPSGESNREAFFLSANEGILRATLFGGPKSRLRSHVSPFNSGILFTYRDPAKDFRKVSDFDVRSWRPGLRERYERSEAASRIAGTILAGHGGGGAFAEALALADAALDALETAGEDVCERIVLHFLWNWAALLGIRSVRPGGNEAWRCASCGADPGGASYGGDTYGSAVWFVPGEGFLCGACVSPAAGVVLGPGGRRWLLAVEDRGPSELARYGLDAVSLGELKALMDCLFLGYHG
jgi:DNA repair protein RecO (recombination protein O)